MSDVLIGVNNKGIKVYVNQNLLNKYSLDKIREKLKVVSWDNEPVIKKEEKPNDRF